MTWTVKDKMDFFRKEIILENDVIKLIPFHEDYEGDLKRIIFDQEITKYTGNHILSSGCQELYS